MDGKGNGNGALENEPLIELENEEPVVLNAGESEGETRPNSSSELKESEMKKSRKDEKEVEFILQSMEKDMQALEVKKANKEKFINVRQRQKQKVLSFIEKYTKNPIPRVSPMQESFYGLQLYSPIRSCPGLQPPEEPAFCLLRRLSSF